MEGTVPRSLAVLLASAAGVAVYIGVFHLHRSWLLIVLAVAAAVGLLGLVLLFWLRAALCHRFVRFPREEAAWQPLRAQRQPVAIDAAWNEYRGILHSHSKYSHDSEVPF